MTQRIPPCVRTLMVVCLVLGLSSCASTQPEQPATRSKDHQSMKTQGTDMSHSANQVPPEVARYLKGPTTESRQFDFLIGHWNVAATKFQEDGSVQFHYQAQWVAQHLNEGRIVMDEFKAFAPTGQQVSSYVSLRTYSEATHRWEITGLAAFQPAMSGEWHGTWTDGEMHLDAVGTNPDGKRVRTKIRFFNIQPNSFSWDSKSSLDDGNTWLHTASLNATRAL